MEQSEFNATQYINQACYELIRRGYTLKQIHDALATIIKSIEPKFASTKPLTLSVDIDTTELDQKLEHSTTLARELHDELDN
ncbi:hypothetical protein J8401_012725 [Lactiplantibacillus plantarum]|uniref:hypothetical protein n=1 Tax=Lactiplantibacillus plantarum TaxID=1590 RepID=UPI001AF2CCC9|nr:hypothetical protein [Lactiplantibacillus plantarum]MBY7658398.1 hypothetical protein [Lactiplantibacillus plantarum]QSE53408.1 hypothetical protein JWR93_04865 [Lactiplantibacillus plantarum]